VSRERRARALASVAAALVALTTLGVAWRGLTTDVPAWRTWALAGLALLPALGASSPRARRSLTLLGAVVALVAGLALATRTSPGALIGMDAVAWRAVGDVVPEGLRQAGEVNVPVAPGEAPALVALLDICLLVMCAAAAWQLVVRRLPVGALIVVAAGLGYRWTVAPPEAEVAAGALALGALLVVLGLSAWRGATPGRVAHRAMGLGTLGVVAVAAGIGIAAGGPAPHGEGWWNWREWHVGTTAPSASVGLDLRQRYGKLDRSRDPRQVLAVETERALPLRAATLDAFDGEAFAFTRRPSPDATFAVDAGRVDLQPPPSSPPNRVTERIHIVGTNTSVLLGPSRVAAADGLTDGVVDVFDDTIHLQDRLGPGDDYRVTSLVPSATPADLAAARPYSESGVPTGSTRLRASLWGPPVDVRPWGVDGAVPGDADLGPYAPVRSLARRVVGDAPNPYAAVNRIESYLRRDFTYDEAPPRGDPTQPPLVDFLFVGRRGFCQHFAGAMGVMLRSLGIPTRLAVGYTPGRYDGGRGLWVIDDRDAHTWVEVWFPGEGWLPFDPTPGRSAPTPASVSSPSYDAVRVGGDLDGLTLEPPDPVANTPADPAPQQPPADPPAPADEPAEVAPVSEATGDRNAVWAALAALAVVAGLAAIRPVNRLRRRHRGGQRARLAGAVADLEASVRRLGWEVSPAAAPGERAAALHTQTRVDADAFYRRTAEARFGRAEPDAATTAWAWRESGRLRRSVRSRTPWKRRLRALLPLRATV